MNKKIGRLHPLVGKILNNHVKNEKLSHAYLFYGDYKTLKLETAIEFAKTILCKNVKNEEPCNNCYICRAIDNHNFSELEIVDSEEFQIKKKTVLDLKKKFGKTGLETEKRIYIINNCDRLNSYSANSMLKFLEEPEEDVIAILITNNIYKVIGTIKSRCQLISFNPLSLEQQLENSSFENKTIAKLSYILNTKMLKIETIENVIDFVIFYEKNKLRTLLEIKKVWFDFFKTKEENDIALGVMLLFYKDLLNYNYKEVIEIFDDYSKELEQVLEITNKNAIKNKIIIIMEIKEKIKYNLNLNLILDKLIIDLEGAS